MKGRKMNTTQLTEWEIDFALDMLKTEYGLTGNPDVDMLHKKFYMMKEEYYEKRKK